MAADDSKRRGLGRGLSALLGEDRDNVLVTGEPTAPRQLPVEKLHPSPFQPRRVFNDESMETLIASVRERGVVQPLLVRRDPKTAGTFEIVAGERRWRAAQAAKLHDVPAVVLELSDRDTLEVALIENIQRADLSPLEEAQGYRRLIDEFGHSQEELGRALGKSRSHVANMLRLLSLPAALHRMIDDGSLSAGHARALITASDPEKLAAQVVSRGLSVRDTERLAQAAKPAAKDSKTANSPTRTKRDADTIALENDLGLVLGLKVAISHDGRGGSLTIHYATLEQLDDVIQRLNTSLPRG